MEQVTDRIWAAEKDFRMPGGLVFRSRMTAIDLGDGELVLHSPVELDDGQRSELAELGEVRWIVAPNDLHDSDLAATVRRFPGAKVLGSVGVRKAHPGVEFGGALEDDVSWRGLEAVNLHGAPRWNETVFVHGPSRSLICSDLVFNIAAPPNLMTSMVLWMVGCHRRFGQSKSVRYLFVRERDAFASSLGELMQHDFDRIIMCHGDVVHQGGRAQLEQAIDWIWQPRPALIEAR